jgi:transposase-like protein
MKTLEFKVWMKSIDCMSRGQRDKLRKGLEGKVNTDEAIKLIEQSLGDKPSCPYCMGTELYRWGSASKLQRYRCRQCHRTFNALTGTPLARLRHKGKWIEFEQAMIQGLSIRKSADSCSIAKNTSFRWRHRFLQLPAMQQSRKMNGIVEADETYFLESFKGQRHFPRSPRKRGGKAVKRGTSKEQIPVLVVRDRHGETADYILRNTSMSQIEPALIPLLHKDVILCTDGMPTYKQIARHANIVHRPVNLAAGRRVKNTIYHIQNVNAYDSRLKQWMIKFHGVATRYLVNYLGWHRMLDRLGKSITPTVCFLASLGKTGRFQQLITT